MCTRHMLTIDIDYYTFISVYHRIHHLFYVLNVNIIKKNVNNVCEIMIIACIKCLLMSEKKFPSWIHPSRHIDLPYILYAHKVLAGPGSVPRETGYT